jgi:tetratricopeptide (TPR) repeat protein
VTGPDAPAGPPPGGHQAVRVESGFGYGVIGADIHVFGDAVPLYLLENWRPEPEADPAYLRELPSRMLNARFAVVEFTGRREELADLSRWRDDGPRLSARWLHAPGGQGKTRLAARFARESLGDGWKIVTATHGPGSVLPPPGSQDLRLDGATGLVLIIDYADRWPLTHLAWLFSNALLHQSAVRTRVLLLGRSADAWPAVRASLANHQAATSTQPLGPLPGSEDGSQAGPRLEMFTAARDSFAARYGAPVAAIGPPGPLADPDFGLTLAVHIAALVAVDAHLAGRSPPRDLAGLTIYLLDREHLHWERLYGDAGHELNPAERTYATPPETMNQTVFTAVLTGTLERLTGLTAVQTVLTAAPQPQTPAGRVIADHTICYPAADSTRDTVLEPLYPDRLAEDFLALTMPGHAADYPARPWAAATASIVLSRSADATAPAWAPRALTFLATAAGRWPHLGPSYLYPLLLGDPQLAVTAGSAALTALAAIPAVDPAVLAAVDAHFPPDRHTDLDPGIAAVTARLIPHRLAATDDPARRADLYATLARRQSRAGRYPEALAAAEQEVEIARRLALTSAAREPALAAALSNLGLRLSSAGRPEEAVLVKGQAVAAYRRLAQASAAHEPNLSASLANLAIELAAVGRREEALAATQQATEIRRRLARANPAAHEADLASDLNGLGNRLTAAGRRDEALTATEQAAAIWGRLARARPAVHEPDLAGTLGNLGVCLTAVGRRAEALTATEQSVAIYRPLAQVNPAAYEPDLAAMLSNLSHRLCRAGRPNEAPVVAEQSVAIWRRLARASPATHERELAMALSNQGFVMSEVGWNEEAVIVTGQAVEIWRRLAQGNPAAHEPELASSLTNYGAQLAQAERIEDALTMTRAAIEILGRLARASPAAQEPFLARALTNHGFQLLAAERTTEALTATGQAVEIWRRLAQAHPAAHEPDFAVALSNHGLSLAAAGHHQEALTVARQAAKIRRHLARGNR